MSLILLAMLNFIEIISKPEVKNTFKDYFIMELFMEK